MSQRQESFSMEDAPEVNPAYHIAGSIGTKNYFISEETKNLQNWASTAKEIFDFTGDVFMNQYEIKSSELLTQYGGEYDENYARCHKEFDAYCLLNRKVQKKNDQIQNIAQHLNNKNTKKTFFNGWKDYSDRSKYRRMMQQRSEKYHQQRTMQKVLKEWLTITMNNNKIKIKNDVLQRTQIQVAKIQSEYEQLIKNLEETLERKLGELKKQEEEHRLLHDKYEGMYRRSRMQAEN